MSTIFIGIAGGTGSGKTTLTRHLKEHFGGEVTVIGHDSYYRRQEGKTMRSAPRSTTTIRTPSKQAFLSSICAS